MSVCVFGNTCVWPTVKVLNWPPLLLLILLLFVCALWWSGGERGGGQEGGGGGAIRGNISPLGSSLWILADSHSVALWGEVTFFKPTLKFITAWQFWQVIKMTSRCSWLRLMGLVATETAAPPRTFTYAAAFKGAGTGGHGPLCCSQIRGLSSSHNFKDGG